MFKNMLLAKKLIIGFGIVLIALIAVSGISYNTIDNASKDFTLYRELARHTNLLGRLQANMLMVRMNVKDFIITGSDKDKKQYNDYVEKTSGFIEEAHREIQNPERSRLVDKADSALKDYEEGFEKVVKARDLRNELFNTLVAVGPVAVNTLTDVLDSAKKDNNMTASYYAAIAMKHLILGRLCVMKFLDDNAQASLDRAKQEFVLMQKNLDVLDRELQNPQRRQWLSKVVDNMNIYTTDFTKLAKVIFDRDQIISGTLDRLGPEIAKAVEDTKLSVKEEQDILGPKVQAANDQAIVFVITLAVIAILIGTLIAFYIIRVITVPIKKALQFADIVAGGDFSQQIDIDQKDEVGLMAEALAKMGDSLKGAIASISETMNGVSQGDFTGRIGEAGMKGELVLIKDAINNSIDMLADTITQVVTATDQVNSGASQISSASQSLASGTTEQAASLEEISSSMSEVGSRANASNDNASQAAQLTTQTMEVANRGNAQMKEMLSSMDKINNSSADISKIIKVIDEIAFQTNLLALNAAVEAARAGKYGKGFAVVAEEVRNLAARSAEAAKNTTDLIENSVKEVDSGVSNAGKTAEVLTEINESITKVNDLVGEIAAASQEQSTATDEINKSLTQVNEVVQANSSISEEAASASEELSGQAMELQGQMARFKLNQARTAQQPTPIQQKDPVEIPAEILASKAVNSTRMITLDDDNFGKY